MNFNAVQFPNIKIVCLLASVGRVLHRYRRGHGFKSRTGLNFFQVLFQLLVQQCSQLRGSLIFVSSPQCTYMIFIYLQSLVIKIVGRHKIYTKKKFFFVAKYHSRCDNSNIKKLIQSYTPSRYCTEVPVSQIVYCID